MMEDKKPIPLYMADMRLRDYFAAAALQGSLAGEPGPHLIPERLSVEAYQYADAMLKAREL